MIVVAFATAAFTDHGTVQRMLAMAVAVGVGAALIGGWRYSAGLGLIGYLLYVGFLVNRYGELSWDSGTAVGDAVVFLFAYALGVGQRWVRAESESNVPQVETDAPEAQVTDASR
jgi:hypothetical protein